MKRIAALGRISDEQGTLTDETAKKLVRQLLEELVTWTKRLQRQTTE